MHIINPFAAPDPNKNRNPVLALPDGNFVRRNDVVGLTPDEMAFFRDFHRIAQKYDLGLHCSKCGNDLQGSNSGTETFLSVKCKCREFRGERPRETARSWNGR